MLYARLLTLAEGITEGRHLVSTGRGFAPAMVPRLLRQAGLQPTGHELIC